jgi:hypothetical protein
MGLKDGNARHVIEVDKLPEYFPTHRHDELFWAALGRTVATFGFLEDVLARAIFAVTATKRFSVSEPPVSYDAWQKTLEKALTDTLDPLIDKFSAEIRSHENNICENLDEFLKELRDCAKFRNVICHGSWQPPDENGRSVPFFVGRGLKVFESALGADELLQIQFVAGRLACEVINSVTVMGFQFPGTNGPGKPVW